jgi:hypothetical protein
MKPKRSTRRVSFAALVALMAIAIAQAAPRAQNARQAAMPDITGSWERYGNIFGPRTDAQRNDPTIPPAAPPPPLKPAYLKEWQARVQAARDADAKGTPLATNYTNCLPDGMPTMMGAMFPLEILQSRGQVTVIEEAFTQVRRILLDQPQKPIDDVEPGFYGRSVGHWEGDTLLVDTIGVKENVRYQNTSHSKDMRIAERMHLVAPNILWNEITITDPVTLEKPWTVVYAYKRMPDYHLLEYVCEDNREFADQGLQKSTLGK